MGEDDLLKELFHPGAAVKLEYMEKKDAIRAYSTRVEDLESEYLVLRSPTEKGKPVSIEEGCELTIWCEKKLVNQAYVTNVFVVENRPGNNPLLVCCKPKKIARTSLRRYARFTVELSCFLNIDGRLVEGRLIDISRSGCGIEIDQELQLPEGSFLEISIDIPGETGLVFSGEAVRITGADSGEKSKVALDIREISAGMKEVLHNYLFQCQLMN